MSELDSNHIKGFFPKKNLLRANLSNINNRMNSYIISYGAKREHNEIFFFLKKINVGHISSLVLTWLRLYLRLMIKISINTDISVIGFYENIENIGKISVDILTKISVIKIFHILII